jgi:hypothetical protein
VLEVPMPELAMASGQETGATNGATAPAPTNGGAPVPQTPQAARDAYLAQEGMFKELMATLPRDDPRTVAILQDLKPVVAAKNSGQAGAATEALTALVRRAQELKATMTQEKQAVQQRLDHAQLPASLSGEAAKQAPALRQSIVKALTPELVSGPALEKVKAELTSLEGMLAKAQADVVQARDELKKKFDPVTLPPWLPADQAGPLKALHQKIAAALAVEPPTAEGVAAAQKDFDSLVAGISHAQGAVHSKKEETLRTIGGLTTPPYMPPPAMGELDTLRNQAHQAMAADQPTPAQFDAATNAINQFNAKVQAEKDKIAQRKKPLTDALPGLATPAWAGPEAAKAMDGFRQTATAALAEEFPAAEKLLAAEQAIAALRKAIQDETARVTKQKETLTQRLRSLADPADADTADQRAMGTERQKATDALAAAMPIATDMKKAEDAIGALEGLIKQAKQIAGVAGKYGVTSDVTAQTKGAFQQFRNVLGNVEVNDKLIADARKAADEQAKALAEKKKAFDTASDMPERTAKQKQDKQKAVALAKKEYFDVQDAKNTADTYLKAALGQKNLTDTLAGDGPMSVNSDRKMKPESVATLIKGFTENPALAKSAADATAGATFPDTIAQGWPMVRDAVTDRMNKGGKSFPTQADADSYGGKLLKMGGNVGPGYFDRLPDFLASGGPFAPDPFMPVVPGTTFADLANDRSRKLAGSLMKPDGTIDMDSPGAKSMIGQELYGQAAMLNQLPDMTGHMLKTLDQLKDPKATEVMKGITAAPTDPAGQTLVRSATGKGAADALTAQDTRQAVMKSMLTPVSQGQVGSCFSTGPVRKMRETDPIAAMKSYAEIATTGTFKPAGATAAVPAVTNLPRGDDPISRSMEYSLAASAGAEQGSRESTKFNDNFKPGIDQFRPMAGGTPADWPKKKQAVTAAIAGGFTLSYDPTLELKSASGDGSSSKGRYVLVTTAGKKEITTEADFSDAIADIAIASFGVGGDAANRIRTLTKSKPFLDAVCPIVDATKNPPTRYKPWELEGGGYDDQVNKSLYGAGMTSKTVMPQASGKTEGQQATALVTDMLKAFKGKDAKMFTVNTSGENAAHSFNATPNDPSLAPLKGATDAETAQKVKENLTDKGKALKDTDLPVDRAQYLFDQAITPVSEAEKKKPDANPDWLKLLDDGSKAHRPTAAMKPKALDDAIQAALKPYQHAVSQKKADDWKHAEESATPPRPVAPAKLAEKLAEFEKAAATRSQKMTQASLAQNMAAPQFVVADSNWGDARSHTVFVVAPDPTTGEAKLWQRTDPPGSLWPMDKGWLNTHWDTVE